jgi:hypothetical protein
MYLNEVRMGKNLSGAFIIHNGLKQGNFIAIALECASVVSFCMYF